MPTPRANSAVCAPLVLAVAGCLLSGCGASFDPDGDDAVAARSAGDVMAERRLDQVTAGARPVGSATAATVAGSGLALQFVVTAKVAYLVV